VNQIRIIELNRNLVVLVVVLLGMHEQSDGFRIDHSGFCHLASRDNALGHAETLFDTNKLLDCDFVEVAVVWDQRQQRRVRCHLAFCLLCGDKV
jgi:hypothetical protein